LIRHGHRLEAGDLVITGTCVVPIPVAEGQTIVADYGVLGTVSVALV
jgi:2-keto-4-pentenoate hydratase